MTFAVLILNSRIYVRHSSTHSHGALPFSIFPANVYVRPWGYVRMASCWRFGRDRQRWWSRWWWLVNGMGISTERKFRVKQSTSFLREYLEKCTFHLLVSLSHDFCALIERTVFLDCVQKSSLQPPGAEKWRACLRWSVEYLFFSSDEPDIFGSNIFFFRSKNVTWLVAECTTVGECINVSCAACWRCVRTYKYGAIERWSIFAVCWPIGCCCQYDFYNFQSIHARSKWRISLQRKMHFIRCIGREILSIRWRRWIEEKRTKKKFCLPIHVWIASRKCTAFVAGGSSTWRALAKRSRLYFLFSVWRLFFAFPAGFGFGFGYEKQIFSFLKECTACTISCVHVCVCAPQPVHVHFFDLTVSRANAVCLYVWGSERARYVVLWKLRCERLCGWTKMKIPKYGSNERRLCWCCDDEKKNTHRRRRGRRRKWWWWWWADRRFSSCARLRLPKNDVPRIDRFLRTQIEEYKYWV